MQHDIEKNMVTIMPFVSHQKGLWWIAEWI